MLRTLEATIDESGAVSLKESVLLTGTRRALVTILEDEPTDELALLSESSLAPDWNKPEEDEAWSHLQAPER